MDQNEHSDKTHFFGKFYQNREEETLFRVLEYPSLYGSELDPWNGTP